MEKNNLYTAEQQLRMECLQLVTMRNKNCNFPVYVLLEAELIYQYVTGGKILLFSPENVHQTASVEVGKLLSAALDQLMNERKNSNQTANGGDSDSDSLQTSKSFIDTFLSKLGWE